MYGRDIVANKNVPIIVSETLGMVIDDAALISAVNAVDTTLGNGINVSDSIAQGSLTNIDNALIGTLTVSDSAAQGSLTNIESNQAALATHALQTAGNSSLSTIASNQATQATSALQTVGNSSLTNIDSSLAGTLNVSDSVAQGTLSSINTALAGTITVTSGVSRSNGNLSVAASVTAGDVTSSVDCNSFIVQWSNDNATWYNSQHQFWASASAYDFSGSAEADVRYIRIKYGVTGTVTARYSLSA